MIWVSDRTIVDCLPVHCSMDVSALWAFPVVDWWSNFLQSCRRRNWIESSELVRNCAQELDQLSTDDRTFDAPSPRQRISMTVVVIKQVTTSSCQSWPSFDRDESALIQWPPFGLLDGLVRFYVSLVNQHVPEVSLPLDTVCNHSLWVTSHVAPENKDKTTWFVSIRRSGFTWTFTLDSFLTSMTEDGSVSSWASIVGGLFT